MSTENSTKSSTAQEPLSPPEELTPPRSSSFSTPGNVQVGDQQSSSSSFKSRLFTETETPMQRSTNALNQNINTAPPFLRDPNEIHATMPAGLVDINLALGALDLDYTGGSRAVAAASQAAAAAASNSSAAPSEKEVAGADISSSTIAEGEDESNSAMEHDGHHQHPFGPGLMHHQPMHPFFAVNEFGQPIHSAFTPGEAQAPLTHPWPTKPGQPPFATPIPGAVGLESMSHTPPLMSPGMIPMGPFEFHPDGFAQQGHMSPHEGSFAFGMKTPSMKDERGFPVMENVPPYAQQHPLQNSQMWPPLSGRQQHMDQGFNSNMPPNGMGPNNANNDRRYPYYQKSNHHHHHHHHHHNNGHHNNNGNGNGRRMINYRRRVEDAARFANAKLEDFIGQIYSLCKDQHGCRFLQRQLDLDDANATPIFEETQSHVVELMIDPFGNYLVQKLLEKVNDEERVTLIKNASPEFITIAMDPHGTRALQKLVECIDSEEEAKVVVDALKADVVPLSRDLNGNHVIQKCLQRLTNEDAQFIFDAANEKCVDIATYRHGCCVLQRCLDHGSAEQRKKLSMIVSEHAYELSLDAFGNYVVQYVLTKDDGSKAVEKIMNAVKDHFIKLTLHKFGSNVIEQCLKSSSKLSGELIDELLKNENEMVNLLNDSYGNYVLQTSLEVASGEKFETLSNLLNPLLPQVRNTPHGRRIMARLSQNGRSFNHNHHFQKTLGNNNNHHHNHSHNHSHNQKFNNGGAQSTPPPPVAAAEVAPTTPIPTTN